MPVAKDNTAKSSLRNKFDLALMAVIAIICLIVFALLGGSDVLRDKVIANTFVLWGCFFYVIISLKRLKYWTDSVGLAAAAIVWTYVAFVVLMIIFHT